jgi:hypothetical protein
MLDTIVLKIFFGFSKSRANSVRPSGFQEFWVYNIDQKQGHFRVDPARNRAESAGFRGDPMSLTR